MKNSVVTMPQVLVVTFPKQAIIQKICFSDLSSCVDERDFLTKISSSARTEGEKKNPALQLRSKSPF